MITAEEVVKKFDLQDKNGEVIIKIMTIEREILGCPFARSLKKTYYRVDYHKKLVLKQVEAELQKNGYKTKLDRDWFDSEKFILNIEW